MVTVRGLALNMLLSQSRCVCVFRNSCTTSGKCMRGKVERRMYDCLFVYKTTRSNAYTHIHRESKLLRKIYGTKRLS